MVEYFYFFFTKFHVNFLLHVDFAYFIFTSGRDITSEHSLTLILFLYDSIIRASRGGRGDPEPPSPFFVNYLLIYYIYIVNLLKICLGPPHPRQT